MSIQCEVNRRLNNCEVDKLRRENNNLRQQIETEKAGTRILRDCLHQAEQQIEQMKNCQNCEYDNGFDGPSCGHNCKDYDKWEKELRTNE